jgi:hypothetical protein
MSDEPLFMAIRNSDPEFRQTVVDAQASLPDFAGCSARKASLTRASRRV